MQFKNITNPEQSPVDEDVVRFTINDRSVTAIWKYSLLMELLEVSTINNPISKLHFRRLFPMNALIAIDNFESNDLLDANTKAMMRTIKASFNIAEEIDLSDAEIDQTLSLYVALEFMTEAEKTTVLTNGIG